MSRKSCYLCGGKLVEGRCQDCGLDNTRSERKTYRLNYSRTENRIKSRGEVKDTWDFDNRDEEVMKRAAKKSKDKPERKAYQTNDSGPSAQRTAHPDEYKYSYTKPVMRPRSGKSTAISKKQGKTFFVIIIIIFLFIAFIGDFSKDKFNDVETGSIQVTEEPGPSDPYEFVSRELSDTGEHFENVLEPGLYIGGIHVPEGRYDIYLEEGQGEACVDDYENSIYLWQFFGDEESNGDLKEWNDVRIYEGAVLEVSGDVRLLIVTENGQTSDMKGMSNPLKDEVALTQRRKLTAGEDFPAGVYDFQAVSDWTTISYSIPLNTNYEDPELNYLNKSKWLARDAMNTVFRNVVLPEGSTVCADDGDARMIPSKLIESEDYDSYYDAYRY
ncbi:hypothetical protein GCM10008922_14220 [Faecalicatena contorta]|uniref:hypothetical protein n=1 Tax=Faecalicatena contorta TaxID=39482 RepID=UPI00129E157C|nr:hypothetical protein [Faecalicatena contorta]MRM88832.1 hypothetical protein [Faecalicatena contorta]